jgi:hypothetical protein
LIEARRGNMAATLLRDRSCTGFLAAALRNFPRRVFELCVLLCFGSALHSQERCNVEVKLLLSPTQTQAAVTSLNFEKEAAGRVYFFDTSTLDLLSQGLIVRLRQGASNDFTIKLRPPGDAKPFVPSNIGGGFDCEIDLIGGAASPSYTVQSKYTATHVPETGIEISNLLDAGQKKLLTEAQISVDWTRVKRIADIQATSWQTKAQPHFRKLTLELWEWPGGRVLELSTKVGPDAGPSTYAELQRLVKTKGVSLNATQRAKTGMVLETLVHTAH